VTDLRVPDLAQSVDGLAELSSDLPGQPLDLVALDDAVSDASDLTRELSIPKDAAAEDETSLPDVSADLPVEDVPPMETVSPSQPGPYVVTTSSSEVQQGSRRTPVKAYIPQGIPGPIPLVVFFPGAQLKADQFASLLTRMASHGMVVVGADPAFSPFSADHVAMAKDGMAVLDWALGSASGLAGLVDPQRIGAAGHSLGGKIATMLAFSDSRVQALLGIDPVNGGSPLTGYSSKLPNIVPSQVQPLTIPLGFAGETTNSSGGTMGQSCAPAAQNFRTFYEAANSAVWAAEWDFVGADHMDFLDDPNCGMVCNMCTPGTADPAAVRQGIWTLATAFFRRHLKQESEMDDTLTGSGLPAGVVVRKKP
jgi:dienelactone hydrolase